MNASERAFGPGTAAHAPRIVVIASLTGSLTNFRFDLLRRFRALGCEVHAFAPDDDPPAVALLEEIGVRFHRIPMARASVDPLGDLATLWAILVLLRRLRPSILLPYTMKPIIYGLLAGRLAGVPERYALVTGLGYVFGDGERSPRRALVRWASTRLYRAAMTGARRVFAYNDADARDILEARMIADPARLQLLPGTGVNLSRFRPQPPSEGPPTFLMIARLLREKGVLEFAEAAGRLRETCPDARFRLIGPLDPNPSGLSERAVRDLCAHNGVTYLGETRDVRPHLAEASVFVLPSYYREGVPRTLQEALAMGRPVITTDLPGCRDTVQAGRNGVLVPPRDAAALAEAMRAFIADPGMIARMGAEAARVAEERFDVRRVNDAICAAMDLGAGRGRVASATKTVRRATAAPSRAWSD
jgi:glycosyltransferase involved in cell wall biosynthesis